MNAEELELSAKLPPIQNEVTLKDSQGNEIIYTGKFYKLRVNGNLNIIGEASLKKINNETTIRNKFFGKEEPQLVEKKIWNVNTKDYRTYCVLVKNGEINYDSDKSYIQRLQKELIKGPGIIVSKKLSDEVFSGMEKKLLEEYEKIKDFGR